MWKYFDTPCGMCRFWKLSYSLPGSWGWNTHASLETKWKNNAPGSTEHSQGSICYLIYWRAFELHWNHKSEPRTWNCALNTHILEPSSNRLCKSASKHFVYAQNIYKLLPAIISYPFSKHGKTSRWPHITLPGFFNFMVPIVSHWRSS
jgi:hypothetical protein